MALTRSWIRGWPRATRIRLKYNTEYILTVNDGTTAQNLVRSGTGAYDPDPGVGFVAPYYWSTYASHYNFYKCHASACRVSVRPMLTGSNDTNLTTLQVILYPKTNSTPLTAADLYRTLLDQRGRFKMMQVPAEQRALGKKTPRRRMFTRLTQVYGGIPTSLSNRYATTSSLPTTDFWWHIDFQPRGLHSGSSETLTGLKFRVYVEMVYYVTFFGRYGTFT